MRKTTMRFASLAATLWLTASACPGATAEARALFARRSSSPPPTSLPGGQAAWPLLGQGVCPIPR